MKILFLGDLVGRAGRTAVIEALPGLRADMALDFVVVNAENSASGYGMTGSIATELFAAGADVVTLGDHAFDQKDMLRFIENEPRVLRPLNFARQAPGRGSGVFEATRGRRVMVAVALGRVFMNKPFDDPFSALDKVLKTTPLGGGCDASVIEIHAEATSEKMATGHWCDGRASMVVGTHTHVPTADAMILSRGTAYQTDAGMCGDYNSVIGMDKEEPLKRFVVGMGSGRFEPALGEATICGTLVDTDDRTGLARHVEPIRIGGRVARVPRP
ncbi:YmdB family metallophosphoesterase [Rhodobacteraceae bacterium NNCM2]|nr:YmdB family metallophosphoesterase [Coraliihabitans acroporae]